MSDRHKKYKLERREKVQTSLTSFTDQQIDKSEYKLNNQKMMRKEILTDETNICSLKHKYNNKQGNDNIDNLLKIKVNQQHQHRQINQTRNSR